MKVLLLVLLLSALASCDESAKNATAQDPTSGKAIATNAEPAIIAKSDNNVAAVSTHNATAESVKESATKQPKQATFTSGQINHQEANFSKQVQASQKTPVQWQSNPELALQTQRQAQIQQQKHKQQVKQEESRLKPWIAEQIQNFEQQAQVIVTQSFQFILDPEAEYLVRWNPPKTQLLRLSVLVFRVLQGGDIMMEQELEQGEFISVESRQQGRTSFNTLGKVYVSKVFHIDFDTDFKYFRFVSSLPRSVFVVVDLEKLHEVVPNDVAKDQHFLLPLSKLKAIEEQVESGQKLREHTYKYEWGFLDNQLAHDSRLLGFTGFELIIIIGAAISQLYFIKLLLDNRAIV